MVTAQSFQPIKTVDSRLRAVAARSSFAFPRHSHDEFGIGIIVRGAQISASGRGQVVAEPGDIITVNPGEVHDGAPVGRDGRQWLMMYIEPDIISDIQSGLAKSGQFEFQNPVFSDQTLSSHFRNVFQCLTDVTEPFNSGALEEGLLHLLVPLMSSDTVQHSRKSNPAMARVQQVICDNPTRNPSLKELAHVAGASSFQTLRAFQALTGLTPHAFILQERANRARRLILSGGNLADIAVACGYSDQSHMTREFKRRYGLTPAAFRR